MLTPSLLGGLMDGLKDFIVGFFTLVPKVIYLMITMLFSIMDIFQTLFKKIAGMDTVYFISENGVTTPVGGDGNDIVLTLLNNNVIRDAILAMILLSIVLLFVFTIVSILRTEYNAEDAKSASKGRVIGKSLRALGLFFLVPVLCYMGIFFSNFLMMTLDKATTTMPTSMSAESLEVFEPGYYFDIFGATIATNNTPFSGMAFRAAAYNANRIRTDIKFAEAIAFDGESDGRGITFGKTFMPTGDNSTSTLSGREVAAALLDDAFTNSYLIKDGKQDSINARINKLTNDDAKNYLKSFSKIVILDTGDNDRDITVMTKYRVNLVWFFYDLWQYDFVLGLGVVIAMTVIILNITLAMMKRVFDLIILTIVAPPIAATLPLDNGAAFKKWRTKYVAKTIQAYAPIVGMNLFFMIVPFIRNFSFIGYTSGGVYNPIVAADYLIQSFFVIVGLVAVKDITKLLSETIGSEDANESGKGMSGEVMGTALKTAGIMSKGASVAAGAFIAPAKASATGLVSGYKAGQKAQKEYLEQNPGDIYGAKDARDKAFASQARKAAGTSLLHSTAGTARGSMDMLQQTGKGAFAGSGYAKAFEEAEKGKYGVSELMKNATAGGSANFKGITIGKSKFLVGKNVKEQEKLNKDQEKTEKAKREAIAKLDKAKPNASAPAATPASTPATPKGTNAGATTTPNKSGIPANDHTNFGKEKAEKAQEALDQYFTQLNNNKYTVSNIEFENKEIKEAQAKLLQMFKDNYNARSVKGGRFLEREYVDKIESEVNRYMTAKGYKSEN